MIVIYLKLLLVIYITNLYWRKIPKFYSVRRRNSGTKTPTSLHEKTLFQRGPIFCVDVHMELTTPACMRPPKPGPFSLLVYVIHCKWMVNTTLHAIRLK